MVTHSPATARGLKILVATRRANYLGLGLNSILFELLQLRLPIIFTATKTGRSSHKEHDSVTVPIDRPILVLKALVRPRQ